MTQLVVFCRSVVKRAFPELCRRGGFLRFLVGQRLVARGDDVLLGDQQTADLQELVGRMTCELVRVAYRLYLPLRALRTGLEPLQVCCIVHHAFLLHVQSLEQGIGGPLLGLIAQGPGIRHRGPLR